MNKYYQVIPVDQKPPTHNLYFVIYEDGHTGHGWYMDVSGQWESHEMDEVTHWLKPIEEGEVFSKEDMERAFNAAREVVARNYFAVHAYKTFDLYLESLKKTIID